MNRVTIQGRAFFQVELPQPVVAPRCNSHRKEKNVTGKVAKLQAKDILAHGNELTDGQRGGGDCRERSPATSA